MKILLVALIYLACFTPCLRAQLASVVSAKSQAMGSIGSVLTGTWSAFQNQAGLAVIDRPSFSFHFENHFMVAGWGTEAFTCCFPVRTGTIGFCYAFFGSAAYNEMNIKLVLGRSFGDQFRAGIELDYLRIHQPSGYGNLHALVPGAGIQVLPVENLMIAVHIFNPALQHFSNYQYATIPVAIRAGAALVLGEEVLICTELQKIQGCKTMYATGMECTVQEKLQVRMGVLFSEYAQPSFGLGVLAGIFRFDISSKYHQVAGYSFAVSLSLSSRSVSHVRSIPVADKAGNPSL